MMEISYERDLSGTSMILTTQTEQEPGYGMRMILENTIRGFLPVQKRLEEERIVYRYKISSLISLEEYLEHHTLGQNFLKQLIFTLCQSVTELGEYLLTEEYLLLRPDTVFVRESGSEPFADTFLYCLYPARRQNVKEDLRQLLKYLMEKTDRSDDRVAVMCYELYGLVQKENFCLREFMDALERWALPAPEADTDTKKRVNPLFARRRNGGIMKKANR